MALGAQKAYLPAVGGQQVSKLLKVSVVLKKVRLDQLISSRE